MNKSSINNNINNNTNTNNNNTNNNNTNNNTIKKRKTVRFHNTTQTLNYPSNRDIDHNKTNKNDKNNYECQVKKYKTYRKHRKYKQFWAGKGGAVDEPTDPDPVAAESPATESATTEPATESADGGIDISNLGNSTPPATLTSGISNSLAPVTYGINLSLKNIIKSGVDAATGLEGSLNADIRDMGYGILKADLSPAELEKKMRDVETTSAVVALAAMPAIETAVNQTITNVLPPAIEQGGQAVTDAAKSVLMGIPILGTGFAAINATLNTINAAMAGVQAFTETTKIFSQGFIDTAHNYENIKDQLETATKDEIESIKDNNSSVQPPANWEQINPTDSPSDDPDSLIFTKDLDKTITPDTSSNDIPQPKGQIGGSVSKPVNNSITSLGQITNRIVGSINDFMRTDITRKHIFKNKLRTIKKRNMKK